MDLDASGVLNRASGTGHCIVSAGFSRAPTEIGDTFNYQTDAFRPIYALDKFIKISSGASLGADLTMQL